MHQAINSYPNSGPMTAKVRAASSKRVEDPYSMRVNGRTSVKPRRVEEAPHLLFAVGEIDEQRTFEAVDRAREKRGRDRRVIRDQRAQLRGQAAVAAQREAHDATRALGDELGGREPPAQARKHGAAIGAESSGVVGAQRRPILVGHCPYGDVRRTDEGSGGGLPLAAEQPRKAPGVFKAEPAIDGAPVGRGIEDGDAILAREFVHRPAHQLGRQTAATVIALHQHHADPGETLAIGQRRGGGDDAAFSGERGVHAAELDEDAPIGGKLVPARFGHERADVVQFRRRQGRLDGELQLRSCHRAYRNGCPCRGSAGRGRPSPRSNRPASGAERSDSRTAASPRRY